MRRLMLALLVACGGASSDVARIVDGRTLHGPFVAPEAYALFLRGSLAEEDGKLDDAIRSYEEIANAELGDAEVYARIARARCKKDPKDPNIAKALAASLKIDPEYGPALRVRSECTPGNADDLGRAAAVEPRNEDLQLLLARVLDGRGESEDARRRLWELTLHEGSAQAWAALGTWADTHDDPQLAARAWQKMAAFTSQRSDAAQHAVLLAGEGEIDLARSVAGAVVDGSEDGRAGSLPPLVLRLAIDDAIVRGDSPSTLRRCERARFSREECGARAVALGNATIARQLVQPVADADPKDAGARMVLAVASLLLGDDRALRTILSGPARTDPVSFSSVAIFARAVQRIVSADAARGALSIPHGAMLQGDAVTVALAVALAAHGILPERELSRDAEIELTIRRRTTLTVVNDVDVRHRFASLAFAKPDDPQTRDLAKKLAARKTRDPLVLAGLLKLAKGDTASTEKALAIAPSDPILCAAAVDVLTAAGSQAAAPARRRLAAVAATPAERTLAF